MKIHVHDDIYELIGEISSSSDENETINEKELEGYLTNINPFSTDPQGMARTKQTARKQTEPPRRYPLAVRSPVCSQELDSDSSLERAYNSVNMGSKGPGAAARLSPRRGRSAGLPATSGSESGSSRKRRRDEDDDTESSEEESTPTESESEAEPPRRKNRRTTSGGKTGAEPKPKRPLRKKRKPRKPRSEMTARELVADWNRTARIKKPSVTLQGWLKKTERKRDGQQRLLRRLRPGTRSLREIRFYQRCQTFLVPVGLFHRLVREICLELEGGGALRWQSTALFALQCSTEAYMAGFFHDINLCAIHRKVVTVNRKDVWLATEICGREHVGGKPQVSDVGAVNVTFKNTRLADPSEKKGVRQNMILNDFAGHEDWCDVFRRKASKTYEEPEDTTGGKSKGKGKGKGKGKEGMKRLRRILLDSVHGISKAAICRLARRGGVMRISGNIYEEIRGSLRLFLEVVIRDVITYVNYFERKTVTTMDVIYALKGHGRNLYGFTR